jgi:hypothetical protein
MLLEVSKRIAMGESILCSFLEVVEGLRAKERRRRITPRRRRDRMMALEEPNLLRIRPY